MTKFNINMKLLWLIFPFIFHISHGFFCIPFPKNNYLIDHRLNQVKYLAKNLKPSLDFQEISGVSSCECQSEDFAKFTILHALLERNEGVFRTKIDRIFKNNVSFCLDIILLEVGTRN